MKRILMLCLALVGLALGGSAFVSEHRAYLQRPDLASMIDGDVTIQHALRANSAVTGEWVDLANYASAALVITTGIVEAAVYVVLQDSSAGLAVRTVDSVAIAAANDTGYVDLGYKGERRFIRGLQRATGAGDSVTSGAMILRSGARLR